jgi:hypothetical protein
MINYQLFRRHFTSAAGWKRAMIVDATDEDHPVQIIRAVHRRSH